MGAEPLEEVNQPQVAPRPNVRAFFGLPLPDEQRAMLAGFVASCVAAAPGFRWTPAANLHLTLRFIGSVERSLADRIADRLAGQSLRSFEIELGELGTFNRGRLARVVWLGLRTGVEALTSLAAEVEAECASAGLEAEKRPFQPHLTLARARARDGAPLPSLPPTPGMAPWRATELVLYSSRLSRTGSVYEPLRLLQLD